MTSSVDPPTDATTRADAYRCARRRLRAAGSRCKSKRAIIDAKQGFHRPPVLEAAGGFAVGLAQARKIGASGEHPPRRANPENSARAEK